MTGDALRAAILSAQLIPNVDSGLAAKLGLDSNSRSVGMITTDCDDVGYAAIDEATKKAEVKVVYAKSFYGGAANANTKLAGEFIGILAGPTPAEVKSGIEAAIDYVENDISRTGSYLSEVAGIREGAALAYLIAPPIESIYALDSALKAADVTIAEFFGPPSETNFGGGLLTGSQSACKAACDAFAHAVCSVADKPVRL